MSPDEHPRSRFLLLVQALEGLYGFETKDEFEARKEAHSQRREQVLAETLPHASKEGAKFLRSYLMKRPPESLDTALSKLVSGLPVNLLPQIAMTTVVQYLLQDERKPQGAAGALRLLRNDLAHGTKGYDADDVREVTALLERVVRAHALRILGCGVDVQQRVLS